MLPADRRHFCNNHSGFLQDEQSSWIDDNTGSLRLSNLRLSYNPHFRRDQILIPNPSFGTPNSDFRTQLPNKHFELSHSGTVKLSPELYFVSTACQKDGSQLPRGLRSGSTAARLLWLRVWIPPGAWMSVSCKCCMLSDRSCFGLISHPDESYRLWYVVVCDREASILRRLWPTRIYCALKKN